jgi:hypothetical protein
MSLNARDVESGLDNDEAFSWYEADYDVPDSVVVNGETYPLEVLEADTGGEGHGEYCFVVVKVGDQLFRKEGYYASHHGTDWDGTFEEVEAFEKTITDYRSV